MTHPDNFEHIYEKHKNRIYYYLQTLNIPYQLRDKFYAEGLYAMWVGFKNYDKSKGKLSTYLNYRIRFTMIDLIRRKERDNRATEKIKANQMINLHTGNRNRNRDQLLIHQTTPHIQDEKLWLDLKEKLTERQWKWIYYYIILDWPLKKIAEKERVTIEAVKGWAKMTRKKLRKDETFKKRLLNMIQIH